MWRNDINCKCIFMFLVKKKVVRKGFWYNNPGSACLGVLPIYSHICLYYDITPYQGIKNHKFGQFIRHRATCDLWIAVNFSGVWGCIHERLPSPVTSRQRWPVHTVLTYFTTSKYAFIMKHNKTDLDWKSCSNNWSGNTIPTELCGDYFEKSPNDGFQILPEARSLLWREKVKWIEPNEYGP